MSKKTYYYDYPQTIPQDNDDGGRPKTQTVYESPDTQSPPPNQDVTQTSHQAQSPPEMPAYSPPPASIKRSNIVPLAIGIIILAVLGIGAYAVIPKNYADCTQFPSSEIVNTIPQQCRTFYGATFTRNGETLANGEQDTFEFDTPLEDSSLAPSPDATQADTQTGTAQEETSTTKGGVELTPTPAPTAKPTAPTPTPAPQATPGESRDDWTKHRYPDQKVSFYLPHNYSAGTAVRNIDTGITTFKVWTTNQDNPFIIWELHPNWDQFKDAQENSITFMVDGTGVIKTDGSNTATYYFEKNQVFKVSCRHAGSDDLRITCDTILKSLKFN